MDIVSQDSPAVDRTLLEAQERLDAYKRSQGRSASNPAPAPTQRLKAPPRGSENVSEAPESVDPLTTLLPEGEYVVGFVAAEKRKMFFREVWRIRMRVVEGEHAGAELLFFLNHPNERPRKNDRRPSLRSRYATTFMVATGRRPPKGFPKGYPAPSFLEGAYFRAAVVTVRRSSDGLELPPIAHYSRILGLKERLGGTVPCERRWKT